MSTQEKAETKQQKTRGRDITLSTGAAEEDKGKGRRGKEEGKRKSVTNLLLACRRRKRTLLEEANNPSPQHRPLFRLILSRFLEEDAV